MKRKAAERVQEAESREIMEKAVVTLGLKKDGVDPGQALLNEIAWTQAHVDWLRTRVQELEPDTLVWGRVDHEEGIGPLGAIDKTTQKAAPNVWYQLYMTERDHLAKVSALALKAGIEERRVRIAEQDGQKVAMVLQRILNALNLTPEQARIYPEIASRELHALAISMTEK